MNRRGFLGSMLALGAAPAIVRADSLMRIVPCDTGLLLGDYSIEPFGMSIIQMAAIPNHQMDLNAMYRGLLNSAMSVHYAKKPSPLGFSGNNREGDAMSKNSKGKGGKGRKGPGC